MSNLPKSNRAPEPASQLVDSTSQKALLNRRRMFEGDLIGADFDLDTGQNTVAQFEDGVLGRAELFEFERELLPGAGTTLQCGLRQWVSSVAHDDEF